MKSITATWKTTHNRNSRLSMLTAPITLLCSLLLWDGSAMAQAANARCSNRILRGDYAFSVEGFFISGSTALPVRGVAMVRYDGNGNVTQVDHIVFNGMPPANDWRPGSGTYSLNPDCTGSAQITIPGAPSNPLIMRLVVSSNGREVSTVVSQPGYAIRSVGSRLRRLDDDER